MNKPIIVIPPGIKTPFTQCPPAQQQLINRSLDPLSYTVNKSNTSQSLSGRFLQPIQSQPLRAIQSQQVLQPIQSQQALQPIQSQQALQPIQSQQALQPIQSQQALQPIQSQQVLQPIQSQTGAIPVPGMISAPQVGLQNQKLRIEPYTERSFIVRGDTMPHKKSFKMMRGRWINKPRDNGEPGWMFGNYNRPVVGAYVQSVNNGAIQSQPLQAIQSQPLQTIQSQPLQAIQSQPLQTIQSQPLQAIQSQPLQTIQSQPLQAIQSQPQSFRSIQSTQPQSFRSIQSQPLQPIQSTQPQPLSVGTRNTINPTTGLVGYGNIRLPKKITTNVVGQTRTESNLPQFLPANNIEGKYQNLSVDQKMDLILRKLDQLLGERGV